ncbi:hypothetical protein DMP16_02390 [Sulfolobus sp. B1]|uniref:sodium:calcium antiporter n=1 Tax=Sulfolobaceae TaxID=118883 RepID=UPI001181640A|nr:MULTISPECIES: sodium:calcium antiporter [unclassified Sulfolobus]TRM77264.1 hypothetical protein DJ532_05230 [Sulfolobus sp. A20-N-F8]TRM77468.1 hypothetical protein DJ528_06675 [Sulfolobus sp. B5]TRM99290.1 hypothetical protein DJ527_08905 [Sulfolobus sp. F1]TRN04756.1 hypothetical protein DJ530_00760 [Sulfolobus sp. E1]TRM97486.1 hypothetical protein DMP16_02390 [Sulfolobus sp. B1]
MYGFSILQLIILMLLVALASDLMSKGTIELEKRFGKGITGGVILGIINALPETIIVTEALLNGFYEVALGSALGGNILLFTLGLGVVSIVYYIKYRSKVIQLEGEINIEYYSLVVATLVLLISIIYGKLNIYLSLCLLFIYAFYVFKRYKNYSSRRDSFSKNNVKRGIIYLLIGGFLLIFITKYFIISVINTAEILGVPTFLITVLLTPLAGELGENLIAVKLISSSPSDATTAIINFMGSKLENMTLLLSIIGISQTISLRSSVLELIMILFATIIFLGILKDRNIKINEGISLFLIYTILIAILIKFSA